jgi:hypothetical protein
VGLAWVEGGMERAVTAVDAMIKLTIINVAAPVLLDDIKDFGILFC